MGRPGMGSGGHSGSGHSSDRVTGGHRINSSRDRPGMSSDFKRTSYGSYRRHYTYRSGYPNFRRPQYHYTHGSGKSLITIMFLCFFIFFVVGLKGESESNVRSTRDRTPLENPIPFQYDCVVDEIGYIEDVSNLSSGLQYFYDTTGVQPYIYLKKYDSSLQTDQQKETYAKTWYDNNIKDEYTFLYMYFEESNSDDIGYMCYVNGKSVTSVMDSEAVQIFWGYLDRNWVNSDLSMTDVFVNTFTQTAKIIMDKSVTGKDIIYVVLIIFGIVIVIVGVIVVLSLKFNRDKEKAIETERILKTPLNKSDDLKDKYL